jgi:hypothetical protein
MVAGATVGIIVVVMGVIVAIGMTHKKSKGTGGAAVAASASVTSAIATVAGMTAQAPDLGQVGTPPAHLTGAALAGKGGLPQVLYVGTDWCPNCAATRWPLAVALSRFGTFGRLSTTYSAVGDKPSHIPTLSFHGSTFTSQYVDFVAKEVDDGAYHPLDTLTAAENQLFQTLGGSSYPFVDFGGKWKQHGSSLDPNVLGGMTPEGVATAMTDPSTKPGGAIQASADVFTAVICSIDGGRPLNVCNSAGVTAATTALGSIK